MITQEIFGRNMARSLYIKGPRLTIRLPKRVGGGAQEANGNFSLKRKTHQKPKVFQGLTIDTQNDGA